VPDGSIGHPGRFIVIDGPDGAGKTTQVALLAEHLCRLGREVEVLRDPGGTPIGERIRNILLDPSLSNMTPQTETFLYMASRAQLVAERVTPALSAGKVVLMDRFVSSTVVYQGIAGGVAAEAIEQMAQAATGGVWPEKVVIIDVSPQVGLGRVGRDRDRVENKALSFHERVRQGFLQFAGRQENAAVVDGTQEPAEVHKQVWKAVENVL